jgi:hypothetical protein
MGKYVLTGIALRILGQAFTNLGLTLESYFGVGSQSLRWVVIGVVGSQRYLHGSEFAAVNGYWAGAGKATKNCDDQADL